MSEETYKKRYESTLLAVVQLERKILHLNSIIATLETEKKQWALEKVQQQVIIQQALNTANSTNNAYLEENKKLKEENQKLKG